ncbi:MAG: metallophosphoesterase [Promethearchaeota archaeon]
MNLNRSSKTVRSQNLKYIWVILGISGAVLPVIVLTWLLAMLWYSFFLITLFFSILVWIIYGTFVLLAILIVWRTFQALKTSKEGKFKLKNRFRIMPLIFLISFTMTFSILQAPMNASYPMYPHLSFTKDPVTSMTVSWYTTSSSIGQVDYGLAPNTLNLHASDQEATKQHEITMTNLSANTTYFYKVSGFSSTWNFTTASNASEILRFVEISDVHNQLYEPMIPDLISEDPEFVVSDGDLIDFGGYNFQWNMYFNQMAPIATRFPVMTAVGNHDTLFDGIKNYKRYLAMPIDSGDERYYYFKYNNIHFIVLDLEWGTETYTAAQKTWLMNTLDAIPKDDWLIIINHCVYFSSGAYNNATGNKLKLWNTEGNMIKTFHELYIEHDVDLVISGHDHHFEIESVPSLTNSSATNNITYMIAGIANSRLDGYFGPINKNAIYYEWEYSGFTTIDIQGNNCTITAHLYNADGQFVKNDVYSFLK